MGLRDVAGHRQQQRHRMFRRGDDVGLRGVADHHAVPGRCLDIDVVEPDPCARHDLQLRGGREDISIDVRLRTDHDRVVLRDDGEQIVLGQAGLDIDLVVGGEGGDAGFGERVGNEDLHGGAFQVRAVRRTGGDPQDMRRGQPRMPADGAGVRNRDPSEAGAPGPARGTG
jgi:hypothetical protein